MIKVSQDEKIDQSKIVQKIKTVLNDNFSNPEYRKVDFVGPQIGKELISKGITALIFSFVAIMIYIWIRFDWQFGVGAIIAVIHDAILMFGLFACTGLEFNSTSIAAILAIIGYSINDSVVIYDRVRENLQKFKKTNIKDVVNLSLNSTLSRTILTSGATLLSLLALILFGGEALKGFSISVFFGVVIGTYSSIYISTPILLYFDPRNKKTQEGDNN
jgi:preprotein translocase subunit SecF